MSTREVPADIDPVELLSSPPTNDDLDELLKAAAPRGRSKLRIGLVAGLIFVLGFLAGSLSEKVVVSIREAEATAADDSAGAPAAVEVGPAVVGSVLMLDDGVIYLTRLDGATVKVHVNEGTMIGLSEAGTITDLAPGDPVVVEGEISDDGSVEARSIQQTRPGP